MSGIDRRVAEAIRAYAAQRHGGDELRAVEELCVLALYQLKKEEARAHSRLERMTR